MVCLFMAFFLALCLAIILKLYWKLTIKWNNCYTCLLGKTAVITGGNTGIGYITSLDFAKRGARVILICKDPAEAAVDKIINLTGNHNVIYKVVDLASLQSVRELAEDINKTEDRLDILVNNAGIARQDIDFTKDGIQKVLHVNYISAFLLTHLLLDKMKKSAPSRIINVASFAARFANLTINNFEKVNTIPGINLPAVPAIIMYNNSKLCGILFMTELAKKIEGTGVTVNAVHPGSVKSDLFKDTTGLWKLYVTVIGKLYFLTPEEGAQTQIYASVSQDLIGVTGKLFDNCAECEIYRNARKPELAKKIWEVSEKLARLGPDERL